MASTTLTGSARSKWVPSSSVDRRRPSAPAAIPGSRRRRRSTWPCDSRWRIASRGVAPGSTLAASAASRRDLPVLRPAPLVRLGQVQAGAVPAPRARAVALRAHPVRGAGRCRAGSRRRSQSRSSATAASALAAARSRSARSAGGHVGARRRNRRTSPAQSRPAATAASWSGDGLHLPRRRVQAAPGALGERCAVAGQRSWHRRHPARDRRPVRRPSRPASAGTPGASARAARRYSTSRAGARPPRTSPARTPAARAAAGRSAARPGPPAGRRPPPP